MFTMIETGLRGVDLLTPIPVGGDVLIFGEPKTGHRLLGTDIAWRLDHHPHQPFHAVVLIDPNLPDADAVAEEFKEGASPTKQVLITSSISQFDIQNLRNQRDRQRHDVIFAVSNDSRFINTFRQAILSERNRSGPDRSMTSFVITESENTGLFDATMFCSQIVSSQVVLPGLDVRRSSSSILSSDLISDRHRQLAVRVRSILHEVIENLYPGAVNDDNWFFNTDANGRAAAQLLCFLSQPLFVAEPYTGLKAAHFDLESTLISYEVILDGRFSELSPRNFRFINELPKIS